ncbi:MAG: sulfite exporter TauE/SafE family protein [Bacteroidetes bacterium]|uniref:Probable membrane transporter protein n=1 Tax=Candidatus Cryptobacteroides intestinavium TaxID=2840766 RepID=A0A9D9HI26_9BACT|nr:sulfite exporter TauE/SafE family protein [Candidatus Cryptobacteroides intestinavium]
MLETVILIVAGLAAGLLSGTVGFGGSMILLPAITSFYGIEVAVPMATVAQLLSNIFRMGAGFRSIRWRKVGFFLILAAPLTVVGAYGFVVVPKEMMTRILCILLTIFAILDLSERFRLPRSRWTMLAGGGVSGIINGLLCLSGPISSAVFLTLGLSPVAYIASEAASAVVMHIIQMIMYGEFGLIGKMVILDGLYLGVAMVIGNFIAMKFIRDIRRKIYRRIVAAVMIVCSIWLFLTV